MELSKQFFEKLKLIDASLDAVFDNSEDSIHVSSLRSGSLKVLENTFPRKFGELYPELEGRVIKELKEQDVWKRFSSAKEYDNHLQQQEDSYLEAKKREHDHLDKEWDKENRRFINDALENARRGIFSNPQRGKE